MSGVIRIEHKVLPSDNSLGYIAVGPSLEELSRITQAGDYSCKFQEQRRQIGFHDQGDFLQAILEDYCILWIRITDHSKPHDEVFEITGMSGGFNKGSYQIASLGGILRYLDNSVRMFSKEAAENSHE